MSDMAASRPRRESPASTGYVLAWIAGAAAALGYLALVSTKPEIAAQYTPSIRGLDVEAGATASEPETPGDAQVLRQSLAQAQLDAARARSELKMESEHSATLAAKVAALEGHATASTAASEPASPGGAAATAADKAPGDAKAAPTVQAVTAPATVDATAQAEPPKPEIRRIAVVTTPIEVEPAAPKSTPKSAHVAASDLAEAMTSPAAAKPTSIETGSIAAPAPVSFGRAVVKPAPPAKPVGLKIANSTSVDALRLTWGLLNERHGDTLKRLHPRYISGGGSAGAPRYDLIAGPLKNAAEARRMCKVLASKGISCSVGNFEGNAL